MRHLTGIVAVKAGANILGLLELFAFVGGMFGGIELSEHTSRIIGRVFLGVAVAAIIAFDLFWRSRQREFGSWWRLFSPFAGGCFVFVPVWLWFLFGAGWMLVESIRRA